LKFVKVPITVLVLALLTLLPSTTAYGQDAKKIHFGTFTLATNGAGLGYTRYDDAKKRAIFVNLQTIHHSQETNSQNTRVINPRNYVYGKLNAAASLSSGYTAYKTISAGTKRYASPDILLGVSLAPSLGIMKPYYISYQHNRNDGTGPDIMQQNIETIQNKDSIYGPASWTNGFTKLSTTLGVHTDLHVALNWNHSYYFQSCKLGVRFDLYPRRLNIMYGANNQYFTSLYITYSSGK